MSIENHKNLYETAATQSGYFTAQQAFEAGYLYTNHPYHVKSGSWVREWRGIYRLARFPEPEDGQYALWSLWSRNRQGNIQGVYSHETALDLFDLSDVNPAKLHMIVPPGFRKTAQVPGILVLYKRPVKPGSYEGRAGYSVLKPLPTILLLVEEGKTSEDILIQALREGIAKGYFLRNQLESLNIKKRTQQTLLKLMERI